MEIENCISPSLEKKVCFLWNLCENQSDLKKKKPLKIVGFKVLFDLNILFNIYIYIMVIIVCVGGYLLQGNGLFYI